MAQRASGRLIQLPGLHDQAVEDGARRWKSGACFDLPDGRRQYIVSGPMHYQQGDSWEEIDNRWLPAVAPWDYQMVAADYQARVLQRLDAGQILRLERAGHYLTFQPMALNWTNDLDMIQQISMPQNVDGLVSNFGEMSLCQQGRIDWADGYGTGLGFAYIPSTHFFRKLLTVGSLAALGTPEQYIIDGGNPVLSLSFIFTSDLDLYVDGALWNRNERVQTAERIEFRDGDTLHWWWGVPRATDDNAEQQPGTVELKKQGNSLYVSVRVSWAWLEAAAYPVVIDPDTYYGETTDGRVRGRDAVYATAHANGDDRDINNTVMSLGQYFGGSDYYIYRDFVESDTSGIVGTVSQANLYLTAVYDGSGTDFDVEIMKCTWASPISAANQDANYDAAVAAVKDVTWRNTNGMAVNTSYGSPNLDTTRVDVDGITQYAIVSARDIAETTPSGSEYINLATQENATQAYRPYLSIIETSTAQSRIVGGSVGGKVIGG